MTVAVIAVPYTVGNEDLGPSRGAQILGEAFVQRAIGGASRSRLHTVVRQSAFADSASASRAVNAELATLVEARAAAGDFPLVVAGSCDAAMGVLAGFDHARCGVVWVDAHGDFNTPDSSRSGYLPGMALAMVMGHCYRSVFEPIGFYQPVSPQHVVVIGARDQDEPEAERLRRFAIPTVGTGGEPLGDDLRDALGRLAERVDEVYLHVDLDVLRAGLAPGIVDHPAPGGFDEEQLHAVVETVMRGFHVRAVTVACFDPTRDPAGVARTSALAVLATIATAAASSDPRAVAR